MAKKATRASPGKMFHGHIEPLTHAALKVAARANDRTLVGEINHRLKRSVEADRAAKRNAMQAAE